MRLFLACLSLCFIGVLPAWSQTSCPQNSHLYQFDKNSHPRHFTEKLGNHPQFPFLQQINGVNSPAAFIKAVKDPANRKKYAREFNAFDLLLHNSGFPKGTKDLTEARVEDLFINPETIGNLGFYNKQEDLISYIYVRLNPAGEDPTGIAAWKLTSPGGCYLYILHTCGNAFYPNTSSGAECCKTLSVEAQVKPLELRNDLLQKPVHVRVNFYEARLVANRSKPSGYDTVVRLLHSIDTVALLKGRDAKKLKIYANESASKILVCKDTVLKLYTALSVDSSNIGEGTALEWTVSDTSFAKGGGVPVVPCANKWAVALDAGIGFNSIPRFNSATVHSQTNGGHLAAELAVSRIFNHWFQAGLSASYFTLSYQDDVPYPGSVAGTYNKVYLGKPIIPVQIFGKATIGGPLGWQSKISLSVGYSIPTNGSIENSGVTLTTKPDVKGGITAGFKLGVDYFFSCKFGLGFAFNGQYFNNKATGTSYQLWALPITGGIRYRF